jgi:tetratricopeptide (TPR) repeat protein
MLDEALARGEHLSEELRSGSCLRLLLAQAQARFALRRFQACMTSLEQARVYLATCEETASIARHALLWSQTASQLQEWERAVSSAMQAIATATSAHENRIVGQAYYELATARYRSGQLQQGLEDSQRAVHFLSLTPPSYWLGLAHVVLALHALLVGELPLALESTAHASTLGQSLGEPHLQVYAAWVTGWIEASRGEWEASIVACQQALAVAPDPLNTALSQGWLGYAYVKQGTPAAALPLLKQAILQTQQLQARRLEGLFTVVLAEACLLLNDLTMAHDLAHAGLAICTESVQRLGMAWAQRVLGQIAQARGTLPAAAVYLQTALDLFAALPARCEVACTHFALATLGHQQHDPAATRTHLTAAYRLFHALRVPRYVEHTIQWARQVGLDHALELPR